MGAIWNSGIIIEFVFLLLNMMELQCIYKLFQAKHN